MHQMTISEWTGAGMDRRLLCQPRHLLLKRDGYSLYAYGDVFTPDGAYLGHIDDLDDHEGRPFVLQVLWWAFIKYWHGQGHLDRWDDLFGCIIRLDGRTGRYMIESGIGPVPGSFVTVGEAVACADSAISDLMAS